MKPLKSSIKLEASKLLDKSIKAIFNTLHKKYKTTSGDISPYQQYLIDDFKKEFLDVFANQVFQNIDLNKINLQSLNRDELIELAYSLDWNGSWDADEEGQQPITKAELIEAINSILQDY